MTAEEFVRKYMGREWHRSDFNCFDLVRLSHRLIDGVELTHPDQAEDAAWVFKRHYKRCTMQEGAVFNCYDGSGAWVHIGRVLMGKAFHAVRDGCVCFWDIDTLERFYSMQGGRVEYVVPNEVS